MTQSNETKIDMRKVSREELRTLAATLIGLKSYFRSQDCKVCIRIKKPAKSLQKPLSKST